MFFHTALLAFFFALAFSASLPPRDAQSGSMSLTGKTLRIQPLGDSITMGYQSTTLNGYRSLLYGLLTPMNTVNMIGSETAGNMTQNHHEGHPGAFIKQMFEFSTLSIDDKPNVILLHIGTNNFNLNNEVNSASADLGDLLDFLDNFTSSDPTRPTTILVAKLIPSADGPTNDGITAYNKQIDGIVKSRAESGIQIAVVDMQTAAIANDQAHDITTADLKDDLHPNDGGYDKMAWKWYHGLVAANQRGWFKENWDGSLSDS